MEPAYHVVVADDSADTEACIGVTASDHVGRPIVRKEFGKTRPGRRIIGISWRSFSQKKLNVMPDPFAILLGKILTGYGLDQAMYLNGALSGFKGDE